MGVVAALLFAPTAEPGTWRPLTGTVHEEASPLVDLLAHVLLELRATVQAKRISLFCGQRRV
jgi:hypothetical protein